MDDKIKLYPKTEFFEVIDTMGVPHPFCITPKHLEHCSELHSMCIGKEQIQSLERKTKRPSCGMEGCNLMYDQHEQALAIRCKTKDNDLTNAYLKSIVAQCEADGFAGFVLVDGTGGK